MEDDGYKKFELADNDVHMVLSVHGHRHKNHEHSNISEFGYRTWWLTRGTPSDTRDRSCRIAPTESR